ncbi:hypothetical protein [uncultured Dokdonia sp.]|uniref:hypothetical protein n=1 Tax=uncultured Dokdonia sp. TaxID=575653 RepID=UPI00260D429B|nr:hypothetical protein [uncultured Dokdonia sp.]
MNTLKNTLLLFVCILFSGCSLPDDDVGPENQEEDLELLQELFAEITVIADQSCTDETLWEFVPYGSKACGGPQGYIAYPTTIDVETFLLLVENYTTEESIYNATYGIGSTCDVTAEPIAVICEDGAAVLVYE